MAEQQLSKEEIVAAAQEVREEQKIPAGYVAIELSTRGKFGAPRKFHMRNFATEDLVGLSLSDDDKVQIKVLEMMQDLVWEKDVKVADFHEKEVVETLVRLYRKFYQTKLRDVIWELTDEDREVIATEMGGKDNPQYKARIAAIERGEEKPTFDIDLNALEFYNVDEARVTGTARATSEIDGKKFIVEYTFPKYGDSVLLRNFMYNIPEFKEGEKKFRAIRENVKFRQKMEQQWEEGKNVDLTRIPRFAEQDMDAFKEYEEKKARFATKCVKALHLKSIDGEDISNLPLEEKLKYADDPRLDHNTFAQINKAYDEMKIGVNENIRAIDPFTRKVTEIKYPFRVFTLLQTLRDNKSDGTTIEFV